MKKHASHELAKLTQNTIITIILLPTVLQHCYKFKMKIFSCLVYIVQFFAIAVSIATL